MLDILGAVDTTVFSRLLRSVLDQDIAGALKLIEDVVVQGRELGQFVTDFTWYLRNLMLCRARINWRIFWICPRKIWQPLKEEAARIKQAVLMRYIRIFSELTNQLRYSTQKRVLIELAVVKLCRPQMEK